MNRNELRSVNERLRTGVCCRFGADDRIVIEKRETPVVPHDKVPPAFVLAVLQGERYAKPDSVHKYIYSSTTVLYNCQ